MPETVKSLTKKAADAIYRPFVADLVSAVQDVVLSENLAKVARVNLGRVAASAVSALTTAGASADEAQTRVMSTVNGVDGSLAWETVSAWIRAATVADSLPESIRDSFGVDSLVAIGRIPADDRETFATSLVEAGTLTIRPVRDAVTAYKATNGTEGKGAPKGTAAKVAEVVKVISRVEKSSPLPARDDSDAYSVALAMLATDVRTKCPGFQRPVLLAAWEEYLDTTPVVDDGIEA